MSFTEDTEEDAGERDVGKEEREMRSEGWRDADCEP